MTINRFQSWLVFMDQAKCLRALLSIPMYLTLAKYVCDMPVSTWSIPDGQAVVPGISDILLSQT